MKIKNKTTNEEFEITGQVNCQSENVVISEDEVIQGAIYTNYSFVDSNGVVATTSIKEGEVENEEYMLLGE
jgi:hypothetical protein